MKIVPAGLSLYLVGAFADQSLNAHLSLLLFAKGSGRQQLVNHPGTLGTGEERVRVITTKKSVSKKQGPKFIECNLSMVQPSQLSIPLRNWFR